MERLRVLENSNDGFFIAGEDLKLRGPGDFFGIRQSGDALFELADIYNHADMLQLAQDLLKESGRTMQPVRRNRGGISETVLLKSGCCWCYVYIFKQKKEICFKKDSESAKNRIIGS